MATHRIATYGYLLPGDTGHRIATFGYLRRILGSLALIGTPGDRHLAARPLHRHLSADPGDRHLTGRPGHE